MLQAGALPVGGRKVHRGRAGRAVSAHLHRAAKGPRYKGKTPLKKAKRQRETERETQLCL